MCNASNANDGDSRSRQNCPRHWIVQLQSTHAGSGCDDRAQSTDPRNQKTKSERIWSGLVAYTALCARTLYTQYAMLYAPTYSLLRRLRVYTGACMRDLGNSWQFQTHHYVTHSGNTKVAFFYQFRFVFSCLVRMVEWTRMRMTSAWGERGKRIYMYVGKEHDTHNDSTQYIKWKLLSSFGWWWWLIYSQRQSYKLQVERWELKGSVPDHTRGVWVHCLRASW